MCRVAFRQPTRDRPTEVGNAQQSQAALYGQVPATEALKDALDFDDLLVESEEVEIDNGENRFYPSTRSLHFSRTFPRLRFCHRFLQFLQLQI